FASTPGFAENLNRKEIMQDAYRDVGVKDPERYLAFPEGDPEAMQVQQRYEAQMQELQAELQECQQKIAEHPIIEETHKAEKAKLVAEKAVTAAENKALEEQIQLVTKRNQAEMQLLALRERIIKELMSQQQKLQSERER